MLFYYCIGLFAYLDFGVVKITKYQESMCPFICFVTMAYNVYVFIPLATTALGVVFLFLILLTTSAFTGHAGAHKVSIIND